MENLKRNLRVYKMGPRWSFNTFFLLIKIILKRFSLFRKKEGQASLESAIQLRVICSILEG